MVKIELVLPLWTVSVVKLRVDILAQIKSLARQHLHCFIRPKRFW